MGLGMGRRPQDAPSPPVQARASPPYSPGVASSAAAANNAAESPSRRNSTGTSSGGSIAARASPQHEETSSNGVATLDVYVTYNEKGLGLLLQDVKFGERTIVQVVGFQNHEPPFTCSAKESGILVNDYVVGINGSPAASLAEVGAALQGNGVGSVVLTRIKRDNRKSVDRSGGSVAAVNTNSPASSSMMPGSVRLDAFHGEGTRARISSIGANTVVGSSYTWADYKRQDVGFKSSGGAAVNSPPTSPGGKERTMTTTATTTTTTTGAGAGAGGVDNNSIDIFVYTELDFLNLFGMPKAKFKLLHPDEQEAKKRMILG